MTIQVTKYVGRFEVQQTDTFRVDMQTDDSGEVVIDLMHDLDCFTLAFKNTAAAAFFFRDMQWLASKLTKPDADCRLRNDGYWVSP